MNRKILFVQVAAIHLLVLGLLFGLINGCERMRQDNAGTPPASPPLVEPEEVSERALQKGTSDRTEILEREEPLVIEEYGRPGLVRKPEVPAVAPPVEKGRAHEVAAGETLSGIAEKYGVSLKAVMELNDIKDPGKIQAGQKIEIPGQ